MLKSERENGDQNIDIAHILSLLFIRVPLVDVPVQLYCFSCLGKDNVFGTNYTPPHTCSSYDIAHLQTYHVHWLRIG
jgi:hypothetical protein